MNRDRDPLLDPLAQRMRDQGVSPQRDLWPEIEAGLDKRERPHGRTSHAGGWRLVAVAAALVVIVLGARDLRIPGSGSVPGDETAQVAAPRTMDPAVEVAGERTLINKALDELNAALNVAPDNIELSRLILMVHQFRGEMLRRNVYSALQTR